jgi:hypothetical protein
MHPFETGIAALQALQHPAHLVREVGAQYRQSYQDRPVETLGYAAGTVAQALVPLAFLERARLGAWREAATGRARTWLAPHDERVRTALQPLTTAWRARMAGWRARWPRPSPRPSSARAPPTPPPPPHALAGPKDMGAVVDHASRALTDVRERRRRRKRVKDFPERVVDGLVVTGMAGATLPLLQANHPAAP